ncbi:YitT family protein [Marinibactrum halimedae]|uniref:Membrane protein n=1 Tax=Marinibactrum halimedae TaxID=1444977 RepID=A0AA37WQT5_9GAMM|nr:YitT family protein [Marinibactrum halimedae]MCD9461012.1 YitT family protein [Marinibactrum halimedae]GLS27802.1 membrane protein [Marinibactrum halimedae]
MKNNLNRTFTMLEGCFLVSLGICFLNFNQLLVSGTAGLSALLAYTQPLSFGVFFTVINLPFFLLALKFLGRSLAINSLIAILIVSGLSDLLNAYISVASIPPIICALAAGILTGMGIAIIFKANASLGGINILALFLERRFGLHSSITLLTYDSLLALAALLILPLESVMYSAASFATLSIILRRYHKKPSQPNVDDAVQSAPDPQLNTTGDNITSNTQPMN